MTYMCVKYPPPNNTDNIYYMLSVLFGGGYFTHLGWVISGEGGSGKENTQLGVVPWKRIISFSASYKGSVTPAARIFSIYFVVFGWITLQVVVWGGPWGGKAGGCFSPCPHLILYNTLPPAPYLPDGFHPGCYLPWQRRKFYILLPHISKIVGSKPRHSIFSLIPRPHFTYVNYQCFFYYYFTPSIPYSKSSLPFQSIPLGPGQEEGILGMCSALMVYVIGITVRLCPSLETRFTKHLTEDKSKEKVQCVETSVPAYLALCRYYRNVLR